MSDPILNLAVFGSVVDPINMIIIETLAKKKHATLRELLSVTEMSNDGLANRLEKLQKYAIIKWELADQGNGSYSFYRLTKKGEKLRLILHEALEKTSETESVRTSDRFVIDASSFNIIFKQKTVNEIREIFDNCKIILTNSDFASCTEIAIEEENDILENLLYDENFIEIADTYKNVEESTKTEYHLRRAKKLPPNAAILVATARDLNASLISDNEKIRSAARSLDIMTTSTNNILTLQKGKKLWNTIEELSLITDDSKATDQSIP